jgi:hypothetical protein
MEKFFKVRVVREKMEGSNIPAGSFSNDYIEIVESVGLSEVEENFLIGRCFRGKDFELNNEEIDECFYENHFLVSKYKIKRKNQKQNFSS